MVMMMMIIIIWKNVRNRRSKEGCRIGGYRTVVTPCAIKTARFPVILDLVGLPLWLACSPEYGSKSKIGDHRSGKCTVYLGPMSVHLICKLDEKERQRTGPGAVWRHCLLPVEHDPLLAHFRAYSVAMYHQGRGDGHLRMSVQFSQ
jgi:hypothetical protein